VHREQLVLVVDQVLLPDLTVTQVTHVRVEAVDLPTPGERPLDDSAGELYLLQALRGDQEAMPVYGDVVHLL
jgi:hypothetical protein